MDPSTRPSDSQGERGDADRPFDDDWTCERVTVEQLEREWMERRPWEGETRPIRIEALKRPFGFMHDEWEAFKAKMVDGDVLWKFRSPHETWVDMIGRAGLALTRRGRIIDMLITEMN